MSLQVNFMYDMPLTFHLMRPLHFSIQSYTDICLIDNRLPCRRSRRDGSSDNRTPCWRTSSDSSTHRGNTAAGDWDVTSSRRDGSSDNCTPCGRTSSDSSTRRGNTTNFTSTHRDGSSDNCTSCWSGYSTAGCCDTNDYCAHIGTRPRPMVSFL